MKPSVDDLPRKLESYHSIKNFIDRFDQLDSISLNIGDNYRTYINDNWKNAIKKYKSNEDIVYPWQELIMILSFDYYLGPCFGLPESEKIIFYAQILDRLRLELQEIYILINTGSDQFFISVAGVNYSLVKVCSGRFDMGSSFGLPIELPVHNMAINKSFYISSYLVTQKLWLSLMDSNPSFNNTSENNPVENISWFDANEFCKKLSVASGLLVRLPTEAEWEYCCRANTTSEYFFGNIAKELRYYGWYDLNAMRKSQPVGLKLPNPWGLYDIVGNVQEWCDDNWVDSYEHKLVDNREKLSDSQDNNIRKVIRGGSYDLDDYRCRSAYRSFEHAEFRSRKIGFRLVIE